VDPVTTIVTAVVAGAVAAGKDVAAQAVKDGYAGLRALVVRKFGEESEVADAVESVEKKPDSKGRQEMLKEELEAAKADQDAELMGQARALLDLLKEHGLAPGPSYHAEVHGSGAIAQDHSVAAGAGGVAVGGSVEGGIHVAGGRAEKTEEEKE
jgi:hypothetical protein